VKRLFAALCVLAALVAAGGASADPLKFAIADDYPVFHSCGDTFWSSMSDVGYKELRMTVQWDAASPASIANEGNLKAAVLCAVAQGVTPVFAIYPLHPSSIGSSDGEQQAFAAFVALVGQDFPQVKNFIVGNEPNVNRFWQPQYAGGQDAAGKDYEHTLAYSYDKLKAARPDAVVWGPAISSRGNDNANAASNPSHSPVWFIADMAAAYKASGRTSPIFDQFNMHPYPPIQDTDPFSKQFQWPQAGAANLDRIKQALWDGFNGTSQPVPTEGAGSRTSGLPMDLDEAGLQTTVSGHSGYDGTAETIQPIDETTQATNYVQLAQMAECDPDIRSVFYFPLIDNTQIGSGFQSGQLYADLAHKASYQAMKNEIASSGGNCHSGAPANWGHATSVIGAQPIFGGPGTRPGSAQANHPTGTQKVTFGVTAEEDATYTANVLDLTGKVVGSTATGTVQAYFKPAISITGTFPDGAYTIRVVLKAATNPSRTSTLASDGFGIGSAGSIAMASIATISGQLSAFFVGTTATSDLMDTLTNLGATLPTYVNQLAAELGVLRTAVVGAFELDPYRVTASAKAKTIKKTFKAKAGQKLKAPKLGKVPVGTYRAKLTLTAGKKKLVLTSAPFTVDAKGKMKALPKKAAKPAKKAAAKPAKKAAAKPKPKKKAKK
jgi:hypothetical protein